MSVALWRRSPFWLAISLILMLVAGIGGSAIQSSFGSVNVIEINRETSSGLTQSGTLFVPKTAESEAKAPAVVLTHGVFNTKEFQESSAIELARRGYVVYAVDLFGHGESEIITATNESDAAERAFGLYDAVEYVSELPYVDVDEIGLSGHSFGGNNSNASVLLDNERETPLIKSVLLQSADAIYADPDSQEFTNVYGSRDVAINYTIYDEFFFRSYDETGEVLTAPTEFLGTENAQSFLSFGENPATEDERSVDHFYTKSIGGHEAVRVINRLPAIHPWEYFSASGTTALVKFFQETLPAPKAIEASNQYWQWWSVFSVLGLLGFGIFLVSATNTLVRTRAFSSLNLPASITTNIKGRAANWWLWGGLAVSAVFATASYLAMYPLLGGGSQTIFFGSWALANGVFGALLMLAAYMIHGRKEGQDLRELGVKVKPFVVLKSLGLAATVFVLAMSCVTVVDYLFNVDFRWWVIAIKVVPEQSLPLALTAFVLFAVYFVFNSIAVNAFNRYKLANSDWLNTLVLALINALPAIVLLLIQYITIFVTGEMTSWIGNLEGIWLFPFVLILSVSVVISRKIYRATNNPYIGGFLNAAVVAVMCVVATFQTT